MFSSQVVDIIHRLQIGEMPDHIHRETGLSPSQQHKAIRTEVSDVMLKAARSMRTKKPYPFNRGLLNFDEFDKPLIIIETWLKVRRLKRRYDRMNKAEKAANFDLYARQIDAMLHYLREARGLTNED